MRNPDGAGGVELAGLDGVEVSALDVTSPEQIQATAAKAIETFGTIDVVFNNAGYGLAGPHEAFSDAQLERQLSTNLLGVMRTTREFLPHFRNKSAGLFITTTSIGGLITLPFNSVYHATKWALEGWSESLWYEVALQVASKPISQGARSNWFRTPPTKQVWIRRSPSLWIRAELTEHRVPSKLQMLSTRQPPTERKLFATLPVQMPKRCTAPGSLLATKPTWKLCATNFSARGSPAAKGFAGSEGLRRQRRATQANGLLGKLVLDFREPEVEAFPRVFDPRKSSDFRELNVDVLPRCRCLRSAARAGGRASCSKRSFLASPTLHLANGLA